MKKNKITIILLLLSLIFINIANFAFAQEKTEESEHLGLSLDNIDSSRFFNIAVLQILDKTTAKTSILEIKIGEKKEFGRIVIKVDKCWQAPLDQKPDSRILLEVFEKNLAQNIKNQEKFDKKAKNERIFFGWMISSSPSISSLEHPVYDIVALKCKK